MFKQKVRVSSFFKLLMMVISFRLLLDYGYWKFVSTLFEYSGFHFDLDLKKLAISWIAIIIIFSIFFIKKNSALVYIYFLIYAILVLPTSSYYALSGNSNESFWATIGVFTILMLLLPLNKYKSAQKDGNSKKKQNIIIFFILIFSFINLIFLIYSTGGQYVLSFEDVYEFRADNSGSYGGIFGYINNWTPKIFVPFLIAVGFVRKNKFIISSSMLFCFLLFIFTGHKSVLLPIILCIFLTMAFKTKVEVEYFTRFSMLCLFGLIAFSVLGIGIYFWNGELLFGSIVFRRAFFVPVYLNDIYFDMFKELYDPIYWSNGLLSSLVNYPYGNQPITKIVGSYLNLPHLNANTGFIASGFMQARYLGIAFYTLIIVITNLILIKVSSRINPLIFNALLLLPLLTLFTSSDLPTTMLTHGLIISIVILYLYSGILKVRTNL